MPKGLKVADLKTGEGPEACRGDIVAVRYSIHLTRGDLIAEGVQRGLVLGSRRLFDGFERGIEGMRVGGVRSLRVPPHLAYRDGKVMLCELELISIDHCD